MNQEVHNHLLKFKNEFGILLFTFFTLIILRNFQNLSKTFTL